MSGISPRDCGSWGMRLTSRPCAASAGAGVQPAGERQDEREPPASRPRRPVPPHQRGRQAAVERGQPVISVDTKKKELVGDFKNPGREWRPKASRAVRVHDFKTSSSASYSSRIYDLRTDEVSRRIDHDTAQFAVNSIRSCGAPRPATLPERHPLQITADCALQRNRTKLWKVELQKLADTPSSRSPSATSRPAPRSGTDRAPPVQLHHYQLRASRSPRSRRSSI